MSDKSFEAVSKDLSADFTALRNDVASLTTLVADMARAQAGTAKTNVLSAVDTARGHLSDTANVLSDKAGEASNRVRNAGGELESLVEKKPTDGPVVCRDRGTRFRNDEPFTVMNLSISGLLGEVEGSAGRLTRQVVENATYPLKAAGLELVDATLRPASKIALGLILKLGLGILALVLLLAAIGFGTAALYTFLASLLGRPLAGLIVGGVYLVLAAGAIFAMIKVPMISDTPPRTLVASPPEPYENPHVAAVPPTASPRSDVNVTMSVESSQPGADPFLNVDDLVAVLGAAGLEREQAGLQAGLALARRLSPVQLALIGAAAGFLGGRRLRTKF